MLIAGGALIIAALRMQSASLASTAIAIFNQITPRVVRVLTSFEYHPGQNSTGPLPHATSPHTPNHSALFDDGR